MLRTVAGGLLGLMLAWGLASGTAGLARADDADDSDDRHAHGRRCTVEFGQKLMDQGRYNEAVRVFTCVIQQDPTGVEGYRGRIEALLLLDRYSDAMRDNAMITAFVTPVDPLAREAIQDGYAARLADDPQDLAALTGASFAHWASFEYDLALQVIKRLLKVEPDDLYGNLFRGSSRLLLGIATKRGIADLEFALDLAPGNPHVRFIVADAYTYGYPDPVRAFAEASLALDGGLDTPRIHAILASAHHAFGDGLAAAAHLQRHIELVTVEYVLTAPLPAGDMLTHELVPGRTCVIPIPVQAGETLTITTFSVDFYDSLAVLLAPNGTPVVGSDDANDFFAAFEWVAEETGTYLLQVTSFESIDTGELLVTRE